LICIYISIFKIINEDESISVININIVAYVDKEKFAGNSLLVFNCQSVINGMENSMSLNTNKVVVNEYYSRYSKSSYRYNLRS